MDTPLHPPGVSCRVVDIANCEADIVRSTLGCFEVGVDVSHVEHCHGIGTKQDR